MVTVVPSKISGNSLVIERYALFQYRMGHKAILKKLPLRKSWAIVSTKEASKKRGNQRWQAVIKVLLTA